MLLDLETEGNTHPHLNDLSRQFGGKVSRLWAKGDTTAVLDWTAQISGPGNTSALLSKGLLTSPTTFAPGLCIGGTLAQRVTVVSYAEMEDIAADGLVKDGRVEQDEI